MVGVLFAHFMKVFHCTIFAIFLLLSFQSGAQGIEELQEQRIDSLLDAIVFEDPELMELLDLKSSFQFLYARVNYENQTYYVGRDISIDQFNTTAQLIYLHSSGLYLGGAAMLYEKFEPKVNTYAISLGYSGRLKRLNGLWGRISYNRYFYSKIDSVDERAFTNSLNLGATFRTKRGGVRVDASLLFGNETASQFTFDLFRDFTLAKFSLFNKLEFEPEVSFFWGSEKVLLLKTFQVTGLRGRVFYEYDDYVEKSKFGLMNAELKLPFTLSLGDFDFELGYNINFPRSLDPDYKYDITGYFNFSIGYIIGL